VKKKPKISETFLGSVEDAMAYGVYEAIMLYHIRWWMKTNKENGVNIFPDKNGVLRYWTYNTRKAMMKWFPYWSESQIRRIHESLVQQGVILVGRFNKNPFDTTNWYTLNDDSSRVQAGTSVSNDNDNDKFTDVEELE
jgi:hypothetical protein